MKKYFTKKRWIPNVLILLNIAVPPILVTKVLYMPPFFLKIYFWSMLLLCAFVACRLPGALRMGKYIGYLALDYGLKHVDEIAEDNSLDPFIWFVGKAPSLEQIMFSSKPMRLDAWFDEETITKIIS